MEMALVHISISIDGGGAIDIMFRMVISMAIVNPMWANDSFAPMANISITVEGVMAASGNVNSSVIDEELILV